MIMNNPEKIMMAFLFVFLASPCWGDNNIEIYSGGKRYGSLKDYKAQENSEQGTVKPSRPMTREGLRPMKTIVLSKKTREEINKIRTDGQTAKTIAEFNRSLKVSPHAKLVNSIDLEGKIRESVKGHKEPILLISDPKKIRIMYFTHENKPRLPHSVPSRPKKPASKFQDKEQVLW
jgi:hypothetical protein